MTPPSQNYFNLRIIEAMTKMLLPSLELTILTIMFFYGKFKNCIKNTKNRELQKAFNDKKKILLTTQQPKQLRNL